MLRAGPFLVVPVLLALAPSWALSAGLGYPPPPAPQPALERNRPLWVASKPEIWDGLSIGLHGGYNWTSLRPQHWAAAIPATITNSGNSCWAAVRRQIVSEP